MSKEHQTKFEKDGSSRFRKLIHNLVLMGFTGLLCFLMLEIGLRVVYGDPPNFLDPQVKHISMPYGYKLEPGQSGTFTLDKPVRSNSQGFRDDEWVMPKPNSVCRIMLLGDSFTFGNNVRQEDTFGARLEETLTERSQASESVEVLVAGIGGWNIDNYTEFFITEGVGYEPDAVVVSFFQNDFRYNRNPIGIPNFSKEGRVESRPVWLRWLPWPWIFFIKRSALVTYLRDRVAVLSAVRHGLFVDNWRQRLMLNELDLDTDPVVQITYDEFRRINRVAKDLGIPMGIAVIPAINTFWGEPIAWRFIDHLRKFGEVEGIHIVDLADGFWQEDDTNRFYGYPWDNHFNAHGHRIVTEQLAPFVTRMFSSNSAEMSLCP